MGSEMCIRDSSDGLAVVAQTDEQASEVMDGTDEDRTEEDPEQRGEPAPHDGDGRADDRAGSGNGGEVMSEDDAALGRNEVDIITQGFRRAHSIRGQAEDLLPEPATIRVVGDQESDTGQYGDQKCCHAGGLLEQLFRF